MPAVTVTHTKFSFVRFTDDYTLPAYSKFEVAFQFMVSGTYPVTSGLRLGVCALDGVVIPTAFPAAVPAVLLSNKLIFPVQYTDFSLYSLSSITVGMQTIYYPAVRTYDDFLRVMADDYGYKALSNTEFLDNGTGNSVLVTLHDKVTGTITGPYAGKTYRVSLTNAWGQGYVAAPGTSLSTLGGRKCFRYCIIDAAGVIIGRSNVFHVIKSEEFTYKLVYSNEEDAYDFVYNLNGNRPNIVRVPLTLSAPNWPQETNTTVLSDGTHILDSASIEEKYQLDTAPMAKYFHRCMVVALKHDSIVLINDSEPDPEMKRVEIIASDAYEADLGDGKKKAPGKCNVLIENFGYTNTNFK